MFPPQPINVSKMQSSMQSAAAAHSLGHPLHPQVLVTLLFQVFLLVFKMHYMFLFLLSSQVDKFCPPAWTTSTGSDAQVPVQDVSPGNKSKCLTRDLSKCANLLKRKETQLSRITKKIALHKSQKLQSLKILRPHQRAAVTPNVCPSRFMRK